MSESTSILSELITVRDAEEFTVWTFERLLTGKVRMVLAAENNTIQSRIIVPEDMPKEDLVELIEGFADFFESTAFAIRSDLKTERGESSGDS